MRGTQDDGQVEKKNAETFLKMCSIDTMLQFKRCEKAE
jgi:hypothetical protein